MSVLKDAVLVCQSILVMLALRYLLQEHKTIHCEERYCVSVGNNLVGKDNSYGEGFVSSWITNKDTQKADCVCCKVTRYGCWTGICTLLATLHFVISIAVVFLKHKPCQHLWVYIILIIVTVINTLLLTTLVRSDTHQNAVVEVNRGLLWKVFSMPFRFAWNTVTSIVALVFYKAFTGMVGWFWCYQNSVETPVMFLCSQDRHTTLSFNVMVHNAVSTLSWVYVVSAVGNIYSLMESLSEEQRAQLERANNNMANGEQELLKDECRLCREILAAKRRKTIDYSDSEDSDDDSFVLGWRL